MKLIDLNSEIMEELLQKGYTHAVVKPMVPNHHEDKMELVPFVDFTDASDYLDRLNDQDLMGSVIVEMDENLSKRSEQPHKIHLFVDVEQIGLRCA